MNTTVDSGAHFDPHRKHRLSLWRIWDTEKPLVMFVGLNPSTADEGINDRTIESVERISKSNGYGGFYMMNCWTYIATEPKELVLFDNVSVENHWLTKIAGKCKDVVFAWGSFKIVKKQKRDEQLCAMFPNALCIVQYKDGSPGHPLYKRGDSKFIKYQPPVK